MKKHEKIKLITETRGSKYTCYYCGANEVCTRDHFYPKSKGGVFTVWACNFCQKAKANMLPEHFAEAVNRRYIFSDEYKERITNTVNSLYAWLSSNNIQYKK